MSMREKIARAMYEAHPRNKPFGLLRPEFQAQYMKQADAVLDALMEPTTGMQDAALPLVGRMHQTRDIFSTMIRAAKEGK